MFDIAGVSFYDCLCWLLVGWWGLFVCDVGWGVCLIAGVVIYCCGVCGWWILFFGVSV